MAAQRSKAATHNLRDPLIVRIGNDTQQVLNAFALNWRYDSKLSKVSMDGIDH